MLLFLEREVCWCVVCGVCVCVCVWVVCGVCVCGWVCGVCVCGVWYVWVGVWCVCEIGRAHV